jgi:hypothetical protein
MHSAVSSNYGVAPPRSALLAPVASVQAVSTVRADKIGSVSIRLNLNDEVAIAPTLTPKSGDIVVVRTVSEAPSYNQLELPNGRLAKLNLGDVVIGALGNRKALKGFVGEVPESLVPGDRLHILNLGGVIGKLTGHHHQVGLPVEVEYLGTVHKHGIALNMQAEALPMVNSLSHSAPLILVAGTSMHAGKTAVACELIKKLSRQGLKVAAAKLSGVACQRDTLSMQDHGAVATMSFVDCGLPSTVGMADIAPVAKAILTELNTQDPDVIVVELGDGILGGYNVDSLLRDAEIMRHKAALVFCTGDFVGAWGGIKFLADKQISIDVVSGAVTDSPMGVDYIQDEFNVPAANALNDGDRLAAIVTAQLGAWRAPHG